MPAHLMAGLALVTAAPALEQFHYRHYCSGMIAGALTVWPMGHDNRSVVGDSTPHEQFDHWHDNRSDVKYSTHGCASCSC